MFWLSVYIEYLKNSIKYFLTFLALFILLLVLSGTPLTLENISLFLTLNKEPKNALEAVALIFIFFLELSPLMAFIELRTLSSLDRLEILAKKMKNHIIVVGCGHLGSRIVRRLEIMGIPFVLIVLRSDLEQNDVVFDLVKRGKPVVFGDATSSITLEKANIREADAIIISINNDLLNMEIARKAKMLNPNIKTVVRIYRDEFSEMLKKSGYADEILSTTAVAVDKYILGAYLDIYEMDTNPIVIVVHEDAPILGLKVGEFEDKYGIKIISFLENGEWVKSDENRVLKKGDIIMLIGSPKNLGHLLKVLSGRKS